MKSSQPLRSTDALRRRLAPPARYHISTSLYAFRKYSATAYDRRTLLAFGLPFILYVLTLAPTVYNLDSAEFTTAVATGGLVRATGYPLYLMLGNLWVHTIPFGDMGYRLNLFSAFNGALTVALAERLLRRWRIGGWASFGALGLLATSPYFWGLSLIAEVYTLHTALMALLLLLLLRWADNPTPRRLALVGLVGGLSLGHHAATVLLIPGCVLYATTVGWRQVWHPRTLLWVIGAGLLGFSIYLYLPLLYRAQPAFNYAGVYNANGEFQLANLLSPSGLFWLISARAFMSGGDGSPETIPLWRNLARFCEQFYQAFFAVGIGPGLLGMFVLLRRDWRLGLMLGMMFVCNAIFFMNYRVVDNDTMFLPVYLVWALWAGIGYQWLLAWVRRAGRPGFRDWETRLLVVVMVGAVVCATSWNWSLVDRSDDWSTRQRGETIMRQVMPDALVFGTWETVPVIEYLQLVENRRSDIEGINRFLIDRETMYQMMLYESGRRPVYIDSVPDDLPVFLEAQPAGVLYRIWPRSVDVE